MECINCTLCMDACDYMMENVGLEKKLIRYDSENGLETREPWKLNKRAKAYIVLMFAIVALLVTLIVSRSEIEATLLRVKGTSYQKIDESTYSNIFVATVMNKTNEEHEVSLKVMDDFATVEFIGGNMTLASGEKSKREFIIKMDKSHVVGTRTEVEIGIFSGEELMETETVDFFGPGF